MKISERIPHTEHTLRLQAGKKVYFVSDVHLGAPVLDNDRERENRLIRWLDTIRPDCGELFLLGDLRFLVRIQAGSTQRACPLSGQDMRVYGPGHTCTFLYG